jgi:hypothetical protein
VPKKEIDNLYKGMKIWKRHLQIQELR